LHVSPEFQALNVQVISFAQDSIQEMTPEILSLGITSVPVLPDPDLEVSAKYDVLQWTIANGEPGHTFVLVYVEGKIQ